jgi:capsular exopolysaccharide synthesis family protein
MEYLPVRRRTEDTLASSPAESGLSRSYPAEWYPADAESDEWSRWVGYFEALRRHKLVIAAAAAAGLLLAFVATVLETPAYMGATTLEFQSQASDQPFDGISFLRPADATGLQTQVEVLRSRRLQERVYDELVAHPPAVTAPATPVTRPWMDRVVDGARAWAGLPWKTPTWAGGLDEAAENLRIVPIKDTHIVQIASSSSVPGVAAAYVNTLADQFIQLNLEDRWQLYQSAGSWLERAQQDLKTRLEESEKQLLDYATATGLVVTSKDEPIAEQRLVELQSEVSRAQADRIAKESIYRTASAADGDSLPALLDSGPIAQYQSKLADLRRELADLSTSLTPENPKVQRLQAQIADLEATKARESQNIVSRMKSDYDAAMQRERQLSGELAVQSKVLSDHDQKLIRYRMLQREADTYRKLYETTLQRGKEASVASALRPVSARVLDPASPKGLPAGSNLPMNLAFGLFGGLVAGAGFTVLRERTDGSIKGPGVVSAYLNLRELGVIPAVKGDGGVLPAVGRVVKILPGAWHGSRPGLPGTEAGGDPVELATWNRKVSGLAESFRATLTSILASRANGAQPQVLLVTSPSPQEGKSTIITNLAIALAEINQRVLLIDGDLRRPRLHTIFDQANTWGLTDLLRETTPCDEYQPEALARKTHIPRLYLLPSGPGSVNLSRLLHSPRLTELLGRLRMEFDAILIDSPPVLRAADARVLSRAVDAVILVVRAGQTSREAAAIALDRFEGDGLPVLGTVLNDWNPRVTGYGAYPPVFDPYTAELDI